MFPGRIDYKIGDETVAVYAAPIFSIMPAICDVPFSVKIFDENGNEPNFIKVDASNQQLLVETYSYSLIGNHFL
jgi:hypothetical protein